jgi:hypothetical protein
MACATLDHKLTQDLVEYGFKTIYHKLMWSDRIYILDLAAKFQLPHRKEYLELFKLTFLAADYEELLEQRQLKSGEIKQLNVGQVTQMMTVFTNANVTTFELWRKTEFLISQLYLGVRDSMKEALKDPSTDRSDISSVAILTKPEIMILCMMLVQNQICSGHVWDCICSDMVSIIDWELAHTTP